MNAAEQFSGWLAAAQTPEGDRAVIVASKESDRARVLSLADGIIGPEVSIHSIFAREEWIEPSFDLADALKRVTIVSDEKRT